MGCGYPVPNDPAERQGFRACGSVGCRSTVATHSRLTECQIRFLVLFGHIFSSTDLRRFGKKDPNKHYELTKEHVRNAWVEPSKPECHALVGRQDVYSCGACAVERPIANARHRFAAGSARRTAKRKEGKRHLRPLPGPPIPRERDFIFYHSS